MAEWPTAAQLIERGIAPVKREFLKPLTITGGERTADGAGAGAGGADAAPANAPARDAGGGKGKRQAKRVRSVRMNSACIARC